MPALQVKECPEEVYERLRSHAARENRSIAQQTLTIIQDFLNASEEPRMPGQPASRTARYDNGEGTDYLARRKESLRRVNELPPLPVTEKAPAAADILARIRKEEAR